MPPPQKFSALFRASFFEAPSMVIGDGALSLASIGAWVMAWAKNENPSVVFVCYSLAMMIVVNMVYRHGRTAFEMERRERQALAEKLAVDDLPRFSFVEAKGSWLNR